MSEQITYVFTGNIIHCDNSGELVIIEDGFIIVHNGKVSTDLRHDLQYLKFILLGIFHWKTTFIRRTLERLEC